MTLFNKIWFIIRVSCGEGIIVNKLKTALSLMILGNILYLVYIFFTGNATSSFGEFSQGLLLGLSIGTNLIGIVLTILYISKENKN